MHHYVETKYCKNTHYINTATGEVVAIPPKEAILMTTKEYFSKKQAFSKKPRKVKESPYVYFMYDGRVDDDGIVDINQIVHEKHLRRLLEFAKLMDKENLVHITNQIFLNPAFGNRSSFVNMLRELALHGYIAVDKRETGQGFIPNASVVQIAAQNFVNFDIPFTIKVNDTWFCRSVPEWHKTLDLNIVRLYTDSWGSFDMRYKDASFIVSCLLKLIPWTNRFHQILCTNPDEPDFDKIEPLSTQDITVILQKEAHLQKLMMTECRPGRSHFPIVQCSPNARIGSYMIDPRILCFEEYLSEAEA